MRAIENKGVSAAENKEAYDHGTDNTQGKHVLVRFQMLMPDLRESTFIWVDSN